MPDRAQFDPIRWGVRLGALTARRGDVASLLQRWLELCAADGGHVHAGDRGAFDGDGLPEHGELPEGAQLSLLDSVVRLSWRRGEPSLLAVWRQAPPWVDALPAVLEAAEDSLTRGLQALQRPATNPSAWDTCKVPLIYLDADGGVLSANPAAQRKLQLDGDGTLPEWLERKVDERLDALERAGGLQPGRSGDYSYLKPASGATHRLGLAPVEDEGPPGAAWLLSVERGGPTEEERVALASERYGPTPRESEVLGALARGRSNRDIAQAIGVREPTVKFHLVSVMRKSDTSSRTELLATLYGLAGK